MAEAANDQPVGEAARGSRTARRQGILARLPTGAWVYIAAASIYLATCPGQFFEVDPAGRLQVAENILERHTIEAQPTDEFIRTGKDGKQYSWLFLGQTLLFMPPYLVGRAAADLLGLAGPWREYAIRGVLSLINPLLAAGNAALIFAILCHLGCHKRAAAIAALLVCFATVQWWYGTSSQDPTPVTFFLLLMLLALLCARGAPRYHGWLAVAGAAGGFAVLTRPDCIVALLPACGFVVWCGLKRRAPAVGWFGWLVLGAGPWLGLFLWYNWARFGSPFDTGSPHVGGLFGYPFLYGLYGLLLGPGKSVFLHAPAVLVALLGTGIVARRSPALLWISLGGFLGYLLFYAGQSRWQHLQEWTVRFTVPGVVLLSMQLGFVIERFIYRPMEGGSGRAWAKVAAALRVALVSLLAISVLFQFLSVSASTKRVGHLLTIARHELGEENVDVINDFRYSALRMQIEACVTVWTAMATGVPWSKEVALAESGERLTAEQQLERGRQYYVSQFWWVTARYLLGGPVWPFLLPPLMLLGLFACALVRIGRTTAE